MKITNGGTVLLKLHYSVVINSLARAPVCPSECAYIENVLFNKMEHFSPNTEQMTYPC
jgi:hypothetical protein